MNSREKGKKGEREAVRLWRRWFPTCRRGIGQHRDGGELPDLVGVDRFFVEVKRHKAPAKHDLRMFWGDLVKDWATYEKAHSAEVGLWPVLMWRPDGDRDAWRIAMHDETAEDFEIAKNLKAFQGRYGVVSMTWGTFQGAMDRVYPIQPSCELCQRIKIRRSER